MRQTSPEMRYDFPFCTTINVEEQEKEMWVVEEIDHPLVYLTTPLSVRQTTEGFEEGPIEAPFVGGVSQEYISGERGKCQTEIYVNTCIRIFVLLDRHRRDDEDFPEDQLERLSKYFEMRK